MTDKPGSTDTDSQFQVWEGSSAIVEQGMHWSSSLIWLTAGLFGCSMLWLFTAKVDQTISVRGVLQPSISVRGIDSPSNGVVSTVYINEGDEVKSGQSLLTVEAAGLAARRTALEHSIGLLELEAQSLQAIIDAKGDPVLFSPLPSVTQVSDSELQKKMLAARNQTQQIRSLLSQVATRLASKKDSYRLQSQISEDLKPLYDSGGLARNAYLQQINTLQELRAEVDTLVREKERIVGSTISQLHNTNLRIITLRSELSTNVEALSYRTIKAPISGTIFDLSISPYSVVTNSETLLKIVPDNSLVANVEIPNTDIGFVKLGLPVSVAVDSFPSGEFGYIQGELVSIGSDVLPPDRDSPFQYFPGKVTLKQQTVMSGSKSLNLQSGMGVTSNIKLRSRPAISLLTDIFTKQLDGVKRFR